MKWRKVAIKSLLNLKRLNFVGPNCVCVRDGRHYHRGISGYNKRPSDVMREPRTPPTGGDSNRGSTSILAAELPCARTAAIQPGPHRDIRRSSFALNGRGAGFSPNVRTKYMHRWK